VATPKPVEMRRLAEQFVSIAREVAGTGETIHSKASHVEFEGPAARRFRDFVVTERQDARAVVTKLNELAAYLRREADALEQQQLAKAGTHR
jgi:uncharacterized protein YukE